MVICVKNRCNINIYLYMYKKFMYTSYLKNLETRDNSEGRHFTIYLVIFLSLNYANVLHIPKCNFKMFSFKNRW